MSEKQAWEKKVVDVDGALSRFKPGMKILIGTGAAQPRSMVRGLIQSGRGSLMDLELIQAIGIPGLESLSEECSLRFRVKTFLDGWIKGPGNMAACLDMAPVRFSKLGHLIQSGAVQVDAVVLQVTPPDEDGWVSLGLAVDAARLALAQARLVIGEIQPDAPRTLGDTLVHVDGFDRLVWSTEPLTCFPRISPSEEWLKAAGQASALIQDGDCLCFFPGPLGTALAHHLSRRKNLGIHSFFMTDPVMDLVRAGAVTNREKKFFPGRCLVSHAMGSRELYTWLDRNPLVEFQGLSQVADPRNMALNERFMVLAPAQKIDLAGNSMLATDQALGSVGLGAIMDLMTGAELSHRGQSILVLPGRDRSGASNITLTLDPNVPVLHSSSTVDFVATEFGTAFLAGRTIRERALALIDLAHPDDRKQLVQTGKSAGLLYPDQIYLSEAGHMYPWDLETSGTFKGGLTVRFRPIKPSDEDGMRRLFYRFSEEGVYYRYFSPIKAMPHPRMQEYVSVDYKNDLSIIGLVGEPGEERIIAEARWSKLPDRPLADTAFLVDEAYQGLGLATHLLNLLIGITRERGLKGITGDVLYENRAMLRVYHKTPYPVETIGQDGYCHLIVILDQPNG